MAAFKSIVPVMFDHPDLKKHIYIHILAILNGIDVNDYLSIYGAVDAVRSMTVHLPMTFSESNIGACTDDTESTYHKFALETSFTTMNYIFLFISFHI